MMSFNSCFLGFYLEARAFKYYAPLLKSHLIDEKLSRSLKKFTFF